jgi:membrane protein implicated in regulation of membrane protease activity
MAIAATLVVALYLAGVVMRRGDAPWYEWLMAAAGAVAALWFWTAELRRQVRKKDRGGPR